LRIGRYEDAKTKQRSTVNNSCLLRGLIMGFLLTLTNTMTVISFVAIFTGLGVATGGVDYASASLLVLGVFSGSVLWWAVLSGTVSLFRRRFDLNWLRWMNRVSGSVIAGFGLMTLLSLVS